VAYFDAELRGLTGSAEALAALAQATETLFDVPPEPSGDNYLVSHSSNVVLLDPRGRVHAVFTPPHQPTALASDFVQVAARYTRSR
jgi:protein SCO1/2